MVLGGSRSREREVDAKSYEPRRNQSYSSPLTQIPQPRIKECREYSRRCTAVRVTYTAYANTISFLRCVTQPSDVICYHGPGEQYS
eukprot:3953852-Prymnesium_polylepis.1